MLNKEVMEVCQPSVEEAGSSGRGSVGGPSSGDVQVLVPALRGMYLPPFTRRGADDDSIHLTRAFPSRSHCH